MNVTKKKYKYDVMGLNVFYERGLNTLRHAKASEAVKEAYSEHAADIEEVMKDFVTKADAIRMNINNSKQGVTNLTAVEQEKAVDRLVGIDMAGDFRDTIENLEAALINAESLFFRDTTPEDTMLAYWQEMEMRNYLQTLTEKETLDHAHRLAEKKQDLISDQEKKQPDVKLKQELFLAACEEPSPEKSQLLRAVLRAPYPIEVLDNEVREKAVHILRRRLVPGKAQELDDARLLAMGYEIMFAGAVQIIKSPEGVRMAEEQDAWKKTGYERDQKFKDMAQDATASALIDTI